MLDFCYSIMLLLRSWPLLFLMSLNYIKISQILTCRNWIARNPNNQTILKKENQVECLTFPKFKTYLRTIVIRTAWDWHKSRNTDHWNKIESLEINPLKYIQSLSSQSANNIQWKGKCFLIHAVLRQLDIWMQNNEIWWLISHHKEKLTQNGSVT